MSDALSLAFAALADPVRRDIIARLAIASAAPAVAGATVTPVAGGTVTPVAGATVTELAERYPITLQAVSKHLRVLEQAGLVRRSRDGQRRPVHLQPAALDLMSGWLERYRRQAEERYARLDEVLRDLGADPDHPPTTPPGGSP